MPYDMDKELMNDIGEEVFKRGGYIIAGETQMVEYVQKATCEHLDISGAFCAVDTNHVVIENGKPKWVRTTLVPWHRPIVDNPEWMDRGAHDEDHPELDVNKLDFRDVQAIYDEMSLLKKSLFDAGKSRDAFDTPHALSYLGEGYGKCNVHTANGWVSCSFHTCHKVIPKILHNNNLTNKEKAKQLWPFFYRPTKEAWRQYTFPLATSTWTAFDYQMAWTCLTQHAEYLMIRYEYSKKRAFARAFKVFYRDHPGSKELFNSMRREDTGYIDRISLANAKVSTHRMLQKAGVDIPINDSVYAYRWLKNPYLKGCPISHNVPEGMSAVYIILGYAVDRRGYIIDEASSWDGGWVHYNRANHPAKKFNSYKPLHRKRLLGCKCKKCIQEYLFEIVEEGDRFRVKVKPEALLYPDVLEIVVDFLATTRAHHILAEEEDQLNMVCMLPFADGQGTFTPFPGEEATIKELLLGWKLSIETPEEWERYQEIESLYNESLLSNKDKKEEFGKGRIEEAFIRATLTKSTGNKTKITLGEYTPKLFYSWMCPAVRLANQLVGYNGPWRTTPILEGKEVQVKFYNKPVKQTGKIRDREYRQ